jgi:pyruvate dehydrogenase E1 component
VEPEGVDVEGLLRGIYRYAEAPQTQGPKAQILASGMAMQWAMKAQQLLAQDWGVGADVWSVTSWTELRRDAVDTEEHNLLNPGDRPKAPYIREKLAGADGPVVAVSDWMRAVPDLISRWIPNDYTSLGTDGWGRSDTRHALRRHFHVDAESIAVATLRQLALQGKVPAHVPAEAAKKYAIDDVSAAPVGETGGDS